MCAAEGDNILISLPVIKRDNLTHISSSQYVGIWGGLGYEIDRFKSWIMNQMALVYVMSNDIPQIDTELIFCWGLKFHTDNDELGSRDLWDMRPPLQLTNLARFLFSLDIGKKYKVHLIKVIRRNGEKVRFYEWYSDLKKKSCVYNFWEKIETII